MPVYVDELRPVGHVAAGCFGSRVKLACHMMADSDAELEDARKRLGLRPSWRHGDHYDLTPAKRDVAVQLGAVEVQSWQMIEMRRARRLEREREG